MLPIYKGILVSRAGLYKSVYYWSVIPDKPDVDVLEADLPPQLFHATHVVNSTRARRLLKKLVLVECKRNDVMSASKGYLQQCIYEKSLAEIDLSDVYKNYESLGTVDEDVKYHKLNAQVTNGPQFLMELSSLSATGATKIKRFYSTQVLLPIEDDGNTLTFFVPIQDAYSFILENPGIIDGIIIMPRFYFTILRVVEPIPFEDFITDILDTVTRSNSAFMQDFAKMQLIGFGSEE